MSVTETLLWPLRQLAAAPRRFFEGLTAIDWYGYFVFVFIRPIINSLKFYRLMLAWSLGVGTPTQQMAGSVVAAVLLIVASFATLTYVAVIFVVPFAIGVARLLPYLDGLWQRLTGTGNGSYDQLNSLDFWPW